MSHHQPLILIYYKLLQCKENTSIADRENMLCPLNNAAGNDRRSSTDSFFPLAFLVH